MAITEVSFVTDIAASPTTVLNLNDTTRASGLMVAVEGVKLPPPPLRRAVISTLMMDGESVPASAYGNRTITIPLALTTATPDAAAASVRTLGQILNQSQATLRVKIGTTQVFFRTLRSDFALEFARNLLQDGNVTLELPAEPFGYGPEETAYTGTIAADPTLAAGSHPGYVDISSVKGDMLTPVMINHASGSLFDTFAPRTKVVLYAVRRHGDPSVLAYHRQAETGFTLAGKWSLASNNAMFSPAAGSNSILYTPTDATWSNLIAGGVDLFTTAANVEMPGTYRVLANVRQTVSTDWFQLQLFWGPNQGPSGAPVYEPNAVADVVKADGFDTDGAGHAMDTAAPYLIDLGLISTSGIGDIGYGPRLSAALPTAGPQIGFAAKRVSGTGNLHVDYFLMIPADEDLALVRYRCDLATMTNVLDGHNDAAYSLSAGVWNDYSAAPIIGRAPQLAPQQVNRLFIIPSVGGTRTQSQTWQVTVSYFPRYLVVPGTTT